MKRMKNRRMKLGVALLLGGLMFVISGCSESSALDDGTYTLQVESVADSKVSGVLGELSAEEGGPGMGGEPPGDMPADGSMAEETTAEGVSMADQATSDSDSDTPPTPPDGEMPGGGQAPPDSGGFGGSAFTASEDKAEVEFTDNTLITVEFMQGSQEGTMEDIAEGSILEVTVKDGKATEATVKNMNSGGGFGGSDTVTNGTSANTIDSDEEISEKSYTSTGDDENALRVDGATVTLDNVSADKSAGATSNTEDGDFYGQNAAFLALNGATVTIRDSEFSSSAQNGNGVFSYGEGTTVNVSDTVITTTEDNSGGIQTTGGGTMNASNLTIETSGDSSAAIRSDRGGGTVVVDGGTYTTNGKGSPAIYSTADITVENAELEANASEGLAIEGKNSVHLENATVSGNMTERTKNSGENLQTILIYQSMSGDSEIGTSSFSAKDCEITSLAGDMIYVTNTHCTIDLTNVAFKNSSDTFLRISGNDGANGWGTAGANGGEVEFTGDDQELEGDILVDEISSLDISLSNGSSFEGTINADGDAGEVSLALSSDSTWTLTGDSYISSYAGGASSIKTNGYTLYVDGEAYTG